jgi:hypothetical protein
MGVFCLETDPTNQLDLWCFFHDAELKSVAKAGDVVNLEFELGYPFMEETAYSRLECRVKGTASLELSADGKPPFKSRVVGHDRRPCRVRGSPGPPSSRNRVFVNG